MPVPVTPFLRNALYADILFSAAGALLMGAGAPLLAPMLGLPAGLLVGAGLALVPWVAMLLVVARRPSVPRLVMIDVVAINALWAAASVGLLLSGLVAPTALGVAFVLAQAAAVALFAGLQAAAASQARQTA